MPILSIVIPTREGFSEHWLAELLTVKGDIEFILVHPPGMAKHTVDDPRLKQINSCFRGEIIQRASGLLNAMGIYTLTLNCDEYLTPEILEITSQYFQRFPDSWVLRLAKKGFDFGDLEGLSKSWDTITPIAELDICGKAKPDRHLFSTDQYLLEIPIAQMNKKFDPLCLIRGRRDHHGPHTENFDKKVWRTEIVQAALLEIVQLMAIAGPIKYVPFWCLDRLLGLFIQAKFFENDKIIGHQLPQPEQIRVEENPPQFKRTRRFYVFAEVLLLRRFPQYPYLWHLIIHQVIEIPLRAFESVKRKLLQVRLPESVPPRKLQEEPNK
uniref:hypothetical protein n=1 Tax=Trichocoleus desertorum TaxID=1481672 RepID=UPI0025B4DC04|nr:hypothetical protein [Trichocoleus desertorum]